MRPKKIKCPKCRSSDLTLHVGAALAFDGRRCTIGPHRKFDLPDHMANVAASCNKCGERFTIHRSTIRCLEPQIDTEALLAFADAADVGLDWHEPHIKAKVHGNHLDNAFGNSVDKDPKTRRSQEFVVELVDDFDQTSIRINLASLLAEVCRLARKEAP